MSVKILVGDVRDMLKTLPDNSVDCVVTSPPYWGLRNYNVDGQIGMEPTLAEHIAVMVDVFNEVRRVMKPQASLWLNYGDCYATSPNGRSAAATKAAGNDDRTFRDKPFSTVGGGLKPKDLCMVPNRLAIALQDAGWWVRSEIIWGKNNPMPDSSGKYRPSTAHEKIWLLTKSARSFYDAEAVALPASENTHARLAQNVQDQIGSERANAGRKTNGNMKAVIKKQDGHSRRHDGFNERYFGKAGKTPRNDGERWNENGGRGFLPRKMAEPASGIRNNSSMDESLAIMPLTRYLRNYEPAPLEIWEMSTQPFSEAHFATFPPELVQRAIKAGCPEGGLILDPFGGAGTTGLVADRMGRDAVLIELNPEYAEIARKRISDDGPLFADVT